MYMETTDKDKESKTKIIKPQPGFQEKFVCSNVDVVFGGGVLSCGKFQTLNSLVLTRNGWVKMGDLRVGDKVLTPFDGESKIVEIFPQGEQDVYELETLDGRVCECGLDHLWAIRTPKQLLNYRKNGRKWSNYSVVTTSYIIEQMERGKRIHLPLSQGLEFEQKDLPIAPYALGVLLGDGCLSAHKEGKSKNGITISNPEEDICERLYPLLGAERVRVSMNGLAHTYYGENCIKAIRYIKEAKLNCLAKDKYIPEIYMYSSIEQRMDLLKGLMDTDGTVNNDNTFRFTTTSEKLADCFVSLCRSLGYTANKYIDKRLNKYKSNFCCSISIQTKDIIFNSKKHTERFNRNKKNIKRNYERDNTHIRIKSIKKVRRAECQCIMIDNDKHLYITDDYIVTHNTFAAILSVAEPSLDPSFRACFTRRTFGELNMGGGLVDDFESSYGNGAQVRKTNPPRVTFPSGSFVEMRQINDENIKKITEQWKGAQFDLIYMDELTSYQFSTFKYLLTRNRGKGSWTGKFRGTTNPKKDSWIRKFLDWYISPEGQIIPERDGVVRYFYIAGDTIDDVIWGDTKKEVYQKCKLDIDKKIKAVGGTISYENFIKSFTFYLGRMSENKAILDGNMDYVGSVAASGGRMAQQLLEGNWNVDLEDESDAPIPSHVARSTFMNDPQRNGDRWITCDLADFGTDNMLALAWDGFHIMDALILGKTTPRMNADKLSLFAAKWDVADCHIIYDGINGRYLSDYIPDAIAFLSFKAPRGMYGRSARSLKDECYLRLKYIINNRYLSWEEEVLQRRYTHNKMKDEITIGVEFVEECTVVRFKAEASGKHRLATKKEMNQMLGKGRSMDLLDPCAMRMYPVLEYQYGDELIETAVDLEEREKQYIPKDNIYRDDFWA